LEIGGERHQVTIAAEDEGIRGAVLLAPAYFTPVDPVPGSFQNAGMVFGTDMLRERQIPALAIFGALDPSRSVDAPAAEHLAKSPEYPQLRVDVIPQLGHTLGALNGARIGPIDSEVTDLIARWVTDVVRRLGRQKKKVDWHSLESLCVSMPLKSIERGAGARAREDIGRMNLTR